MAEYIDGNRLNTDLRYRFDYLSKFLNFTADDIAMLNTFAPIVFPLIPVIADTLYRKLFSFNITKQYFLVQNEGFEGFLPKTIHGITLESPQTELRKDVLSTYLEHVLAQSDWNDSFLQYLSHVGQMHTNKAGSPSVNVDYIHINALLGYLEHLLIDTLHRADHVADQTKHGILTATNLRYRYDYLSKFLNFTSEDIPILNAFAPVLFPRVPVVADTVYRKLFSFDITKQYFLVHNQGFDKFHVCAGSNITIESAQMTFRKDMLSMYLKRVLTQREWNDSFLQYLSQVGRMHTNKAGSASINLDYIHINALLGYLEHLLIEILENTENLDEKTRHRTVLAINKFFWIQNDFFTMHYLTAWNDNPTTKDESMKKPKFCCV